jgi:hypothetical protein
MYSSEYTSGFPGPAASHLTAPPSPRYEGNVGQAPRNAILANDHQAHNATAISDAGNLVHP